MQRAVAEKKALKKQVAILKAQRKKLRKKFVGEARERRELNKRIKATLRVIQTQQDAAQAAEESTDDVLSKSEVSPCERSASEETKTKRSGGAEMEVD